MIHYVKKGKGKPLLLLHGLGGDHISWEKLEPFLQGYRLIIPDLPGHGKSVDFKRICWKVFLDSIDEVLRKENIDKAVFIGFSLGGMITLHYAISHRKKTAALIIINSTAYFERKPPLPDFLRAMLGMDIRNLGEAVGIIKSFFDMRSDFFIQAMKLGFNHNIKEKVRKLKGIPSLVMGSKRDVLIHSHLSKETARLMNARYVDIDSPHSSIYYEPERVGKEIKRFLKWINY